MHLPYLAVSTEMVHCDPQLKSVAAEPKLDMIFKHVQPILGGLNQPSVHMPDQELVGEKNQEVVCGPDQGVVGPPVSDVACVQAQETVGLQNREIVGFHARDATGKAVDISPPLSYGVFRQPYTGRPLHNPMFKAAVAHLSSKPIPSLPMVMATPRLGYVTGTFTPFFGESASAFPSQPLLLPSPPVLPQPETSTISIQDWKKRVAARPAGASVAPGPVVADDFSDFDPYIAEADKKMAAHLKRRLKQNQKRKIGRISAAKARAMGGGPNVPNR